MPAMLISPNGGLNGPLGGSFPDRLRSFGTALADKVVGSIVADRKANRNIQWGLMTPGCDGLPNLNVMNDVTCCTTCDEGGGGVDLLDGGGGSGNWVLLNIQHGIPTLASTNVARPFASTSGPAIVSRSSGFDPADIQFRISLLDTHGNKFRIVEETVDGVVMAAGSLRSTGNTPTPARTGSDPNRYVSSFLFFTTDVGVDVRPISQQTWLQFPALTGANSGPSWPGGTTLTASGVRICRPPNDLTDGSAFYAQYSQLPVANRGFFGECGKNVVKFGDPLGQTYYLYTTAQMVGHPMVLGTGLFDGDGFVRSVDYLFGVEAPLPTGNNAAACTANPNSQSGSNGPIPAGNLGIMVRDAVATGADLLRPLTWAPIPENLPGGAIVRASTGGSPAARPTNIFACAEGSIFVHAVGATFGKTVYQFRYDAETNKLIHVRTITLTSEGAAWNSDTILSAVLEVY